MSVVLFVCEFPRVLQVVAGGAGTRVCLFVTLRRRVQSGGALYCVGACELLTVCVCV